MTTDEILAVLKDRGLAVVCDDGGNLALRGDKAQATPALLRVLAFHKGELVERFRPKPAMELLWPGPPPYQGDGCVSPHWFPDAGWPCGAKFWRYVGETEWQPIPGKPYPCNVNV